jgi:hypothetical protein
MLSAAEVMCPEEVGASSSVHKTRATSVPKTRNTTPAALRNCKPHNAQKLKGKPEGALKGGKKMKATYIWQMATFYNWGRYVPFSSFFFLIFWDLFYGVFVRFATRGVQKHHKCFLGEVHVKSFWPK